MNEGHTSHKHSGKRMARKNNGIPQYDHFRKGREEMTVALLVIPDESGAKG